MFVRFCFGQICAVITRTVRKAKINKNYQFAFLTVWVKLLMRLAWLLAQCFDVNYILM